MSSIICRTFARILGDAPYLPSIIQHHDDGRQANLMGFFFRSRIAPIHTEKQILLFLLVYRCPWLSQHASLARNGGKSSAIVIFLLFVGKKALTTTASVSCHTTTQDTLASRALATVNIEHQLLLLIEERGCTNYAFIQLSNIPSIIPIHRERKKSMFYYSYRLLSTAQYHTSHFKERR